MKLLKKRLTTKTCKGKEVTKKMDLKSNKKKLNKDEFFFKNKIIPKKQLQLK
jgi:hypothetical protein